MPELAEKVHLVGSIPFADAEEVFRTVSSTLAGNVSRIPDGETGERRFFIDWHIGVIAAQREHLEWVSPPPDVQKQTPSFRLRPGVDPADVSFGPFGYARWAQESYATFARLKQEGVIASDVRFQVNLPAPLTPVRGFFADDETRNALEGRYEEALLGEASQIVEAIPEGELALQWDVCTEMAIWEGEYAAYYPGDAKEGILQRLLRCADVATSDADLGFHLCYGDYQHRHFMEPTTLRPSVEMINGVAAAASRPVSYVHMTVPRSRDDEAYYAPLSELQLDPETEVFLGLLHLTDGVAGAERRIAVAERALADFGVATECGFGRRPVESITTLLDIHRQIAQRRVVA